MKTSQCGQKSLACPTALISPRTLLCNCLNSQNLAFRKCFLPGHHRKVCGYSMPPLPVSYLSQAVVVCSGCHDKLPQAGPLRQQKCIVSPSAGWKSEFKVLVGLASQSPTFCWLSASHSMEKHHRIFPPSSCGLPVCPSVSKFPLYMRTPVLLDQD